MFADISAQRQPKGQSLVETALFLPILILLLAGLVEVSNLLVTQNRLTTAARAASGFAAANYAGDEWEETDVWTTAMGNVALNNVTTTLQLEPELWDIWAVKATLNPDGDAFEEWESHRAYGDGQVVTNTEWTVMETQIMSDVLEALDESEQGLEVVATVAFHDRQSLLGLNAFNFGPFTRVRGLSVMRVDDPADFAGCPLVPISVRLNQYSAYPSNWTPGVQYEGNNGQYPGDPATQLFPEGADPNSGFDYPTGADIPVYVNDPGVTPPRLHTSTFVDNVPGVPLVDAQPGYVYWAREQGPSGGFGWLSWDGSTSASDLRDSLTPPGNFRETYPGGPADTNTTGDPPSPSEPIGGDTTTGNGDGVLAVGEWVENSTGNIASSEGILQDYIDNMDTVTLLAFDITNGKTGSNANYRVSGFVKANLLGYSVHGSDKWLLFQFVDWGGECKAIE